MTRVNERHLIELRKLDEYTILTHRTKRQTGFWLHTHFIAYGDRCASFRWNVVRSENQIQHSI